MRSSPRLNPSLIQRTLLALVLTAVGLAPARLVGAQATAMDSATITALIDRTLTRAVPTGAAGCVVGVALGELQLTRSAGMADLERASPLLTQSISEAGSVSKQFTAAAVLLLAMDGAVDLDADAREWLPELPEYEAPVTVRHLLTHTSGLRDWGAIAALEGWPRGERAHTNAHVLQIAARQQALNYSPGLTYSYTNTGYNLLAILVERVSGKSLARFTAERLFEPLGMTHTSWRDDHERIVPGRALAYTGGSTPTLDMPDESAYGNGGLLTTAGDMLRWVAALNRQAFSEAFTEAMQERMVLTFGDTIDYAMGVNVLDHRGTRELSHSGSTGGYRAHLLHFPERRAGVAVLCNSAARNATQLAEQLADSLVGPRQAQPRRVDPTVRPVAGARRQLVVKGNAYAALVGVYASPEVHGEPFEVRLLDEHLELRQAPNLRLVMQADPGRVFTAGDRHYWFERDATGRAIALHVAQDRAWDVRLPRISAWDAPQ